MGLTFKIPTHKKFGISPKEFDISINLKSIDRDVDALVKRNLPKVGSIIRVHMAKTIGQIVLDLMSKVQPRTPIDTGELRESGRGRLLLGTKWINIAKGTPEGIIVDLTGKISANLLKKATKLSFNVS